MSHHQAFNVYLRGKKIDKVFYTRSSGETLSEAKESVRRSLVNHDGYDPGIKVTAEMPTDPRKKAAP